MDNNTWPKVKIFFQFFKYGFASIFTYLFLFAGVYVLTDLAGLRANLSYLIVLTLTYGLNYLLAVKFIFPAEFNRRNFLMYGIYVFIFWSLNNLFFNILFKFLDIHYLIITAINIAIFAPLRFLSLRHIFNK